ncbi:MAG TPA: tRNA (adenosine(37)-N6)-threonylcarbamoyltransferase complex dimerization subunit type 1 TsaB [Candidatus Solibacter sp.]|jgi:tRNA threonylcarbamoyl adenosine modification protein YeaZ|nr:tRNA (adenosine(37)-N6)-threonylcarbamoyltransferase complex dimerization subunit type 1 TsaB [Candidatus Solibacter sp.]
MILALDTSGGELLLALIDGERMVTGMARRGTRHQDHVLEAIAEVAGGRLGDIDAIAVARGPGSHTGLRVGLSAAAGLAYTRRLHIYPISSLDIAAQRAPDGHGLVTAMVVAGRGRVFAQDYERDGSQRRPRGDRALLRIEDAGNGGRHPSAEPDLMETIAPGSAAEMRGGAEALAAAVIQVADGVEGVNYDQLKGDYGEPPE